jgi:DnaJ-domain-containing protein 1
VDVKYSNWQKALQKGRKEKLQRELKKMSGKLQEHFLKFYYKQKVVEEMIVVAGNVHEKFQASLRHIQELEAQRTTTERRATLDAEHAKIQTLEQFVRMPREEFSKVFKELKAAADRG